MSQPDHSVDTAPAGHRQAWAVYVDCDLLAESGTAVIEAAIADLVRRPGHEPTVRAVIEPVHELLHVDDVGWVCPTCWERHEYTGSLQYVETVDEARHVDLAESTRTSLSVYDASIEVFEGDPIDPRIWCRQCCTRYALPTDVKIDLG